MSGQWSEVCPACKGYPDQAHTCSPSTDALVVDIAKWLPPENESTARRKLATLHERLRLAEEEIRIREQSQIPVVPKAIAERLEAAERALRVSECKRKVLVFPETHEDIVGERFE